MFFKGYCFTCRESTEESLVIINSTTGPGQMSFHLLADATVRMSAVCLCNALSISIIHILIKFLSDIRTQS